MPALCLAEAEVSWPGTAAHLGSLEAVEIVDLSHPQLQPVADIVRLGVAWQVAHAVVTGQGDPEWPDGRPILTAVPDAYKGLPATVVAV